MDFMLFIHALFALIVVVGLMLLVFWGIKYCEVKGCKNPFLKKLNIHNNITQLKDSYDSNLSKTPSLLSDKDKFLLGLARCILTNSEILIIYEFPTGLTKEEIKLLENILLSLKKKKTIILFSAHNYFNNILDKHYLINQGNVTQTSNNKKES